MRILITGATGVIGTETADRLLSHPAAPDLVRVARRATDTSIVCWNIGQEPAPPALAGRWDTIVHTAAATHWSMTRDEATTNINTLRAVLGLAGPETHVVHVSTAYVDGARLPAGCGGTEFEGYRNGYEWSKAACEEIVSTRHRGPVTVVRPPLVMGRRGDGGITRFSGPYTLLPALVSGLAAVVVGDPDGYAEISPVDEVADVIVDAALGAPPTAPRTEVIAGGQGSLRLARLVDIACDTINTYRTTKGVEPIDRPPTVSTDSWNRFFLPLAEQWLSPAQQRAVKLLAMFQSYTSMSRPFEPTRQVRDSGEVMAASVWYWAENRHRRALATPSPWTLIADRQR
ncbi:MULTISPECIES: SDR family oxidoreductase [unclassified Frankia]|uniref:SDR family oxidoreductase n=1 Tax=unclassified Frankia TaxID=2632575 RepID=UPI001EF70504|nr:MULTISPECIES: SDR family oxidoreductase [unclassified Frankia]